MNDIDIRSAIQSAHVLIVDDEPANVRLLERVLQKDGFTNLVSLTDSRRVAEHCAVTPPDLVLLDLMMPYCDGFAIMEMLKSQVYGAYLPILMLTADVAPRTRERALSNGAQDFLTKPFNTTEVLLRVRNLLTVRALQLELRNQNQLLEARVQERTRALEESQLEVLERLAQAAEFRDDDTGTAHAARRHFGGPSGARTGSRRRGGRGHSPRRAAARCRQNRRFRSDSFEAGPTHGRRVSRR